MNHIVFENAPRTPARQNARMDVACFVGFARRRSAVPIAPWILRWLEEAGWASGSAKRIEDESSTLHDVPVPIDRWETFDRHFAWDCRDEDETPPTATPLGPAVRSFFAQGGCKCYVVAIEWTSMPNVDQEKRLAWLNHLLPGCGEAFDPSPIDPTTWTGAAHVFGLPDVSFLCLPDLAMICSTDVNPGPPRCLPARPLETFVECSTPAYEPPESSLPSIESVPRCDSAGYRAWTQFVNRVSAMLSRHAREIQFVVALPLPCQEGPTLAAHEDLYAFLCETVLPIVQSPFVQIVYPWVKTPGSNCLPGGLESPDAILVGMLAANALARGTFRSAIGRGLGDVIDLHPILPRHATATKMPVDSNASRELALVDRISLFAPTPTGFRLFSDVTTSPDDDHRQGGIHRLFTILTRAVRTAGASVVFEPANHTTRANLVFRIERVLKQLWELGALRGASAREAFSVRCDSTTMTHADVDGGRIVTEIEFAPALAIERIRVVLTLSEGGNATLQSRSMP